MKAVIDRIENNIAVIIFEDKGIELNIPTELLPKNSTEGDWLIFNISIDQNTTSSMYLKNKALLNKIKKKTDL